MIKNNNQNTEILNLQLYVSEKDSHKEAELEKVLNDKGKKNHPLLYGSGILVINASSHLDEEPKKVIDFSSSFFWKKD